MQPQVSIIGAGLAGSEAALVLAAHGIAVRLYEMRPAVSTPAHATGLPAELVCSNSLKSDKLPSAHGLLKAELSALGSPLIAAARCARVPAGSALAVDRDHFSRLVLERLQNNPRIELVCREIARPPEDTGLCLIAAGPLVSENLAQWLSGQAGVQRLHFYDAIAPIVAADSIDMHRAFAASRWEEQGSDYINCPFSREEYQRFHDALIAADEVTAREFEDARFFEACLPVEVVARRGFQALTFGTMRPVGLTDPATGRWPFAVCQLRRETAGGESYNLVGFQTRMTIGAQQQVLRLIPGLEKAEFLRYGSIHRNTYLDGPQVLAADFSLKADASVFLAGQLCGNEGYTESIATGHLAALNCAARLQGRQLPPLRPVSALGAMWRHVTASPVTPFTPTNINFGLIDPLDAVPRRIGKAARQQLYCDRALAELEEWKHEHVGEYVCLPQ